jgi:FkbM family methyltransferase
MTKITIDMIKSVIEESSLPGQIDKETRLLLYGAGNIGRKVCAAFINLGYNVLGFLDQSAESDRYIDIGNTHLCVSRADLPNYSIDDRRNVCVVLTIHNRDTYLPEIVEYLHHLGYANVYSLAKVYDILADDLKGNFWLDNRKIYKNCLKKIVEVDSIWADQTSQDLYRSILFYRLTGDFNYLPDVDQNAQYFPQDLPALTRPLRFIDCGAYDGDTLKYIYGNNFKIEVMALFEPDLENFNKLSQYCQQLPLPELILFPCGVYHQTGIISFEDQQQEGSKISPSGSHMITCVSLDDVLLHFNPNMIKMDIEGAELNALTGARRMIEKSCPELAISIYHAIDHLWEIPKLIKELGEIINFICVFMEKIHLNRFCMQFLSGRSD